MVALGWRALAYGRSTTVLIFPAVGRTRHTSHVQGQILASIGVIFSTEVFVPILLVLSLLGNGPLCPRVRPETSLQGFLAHKKTPAPLGP